MIALATVATALLAVIGLEALPRDIFPSSSNEREISPVLNITPEPQPRPDGSRPGTAVAPRPDRGESSTAEGRRSVRPRQTRRSETASRPSPAATSRPSTSTAPAPKPTPTQASPAPAPSPSPSPSCTPRGNSTRCKPRGAPGKSDPLDTPVPYSGSYTTSGGTSSGVSAASPDRDKTPAATGPREKKAKRGQPAGK